MSIITRNIISNNFSLKKLEDNSVYNKKILDDKINLWKYILKYRCKAKEQESILIGITILGIDYFAICFAALELSMKIVIVDYNRNDNFSNIEYKDPKTKILSPIDIFLHDVDDFLFKKNDAPINKFKFFTNSSCRTYNINKIDYAIDNEEQYQNAISIFPQSSNVAICCTSSGTTGTPKIVEHTHEFIYNISKRNSTKFLGDCLHIRNLNHGSSIAVFLLPSLMSDNVTTHLVYDVDEYQTFDIFINKIKDYQETLHFINFPYPFMIDKFIDSSVSNSIKWPNLKIQTLSYIQESSKNAIKNNIFNSITSIFGSNETSGPVFECTITKNNIDQPSSYFKKVDNFYDIDLDNYGLISVKMPVYNTSIVTNDVFKIIDDFYVHKGRKDIVKINGEIIDYNVINQLNQEYQNSYIVIDSLENSLYLAFWNKIDNEVLYKIKKFLKTHYKRISINKIAILDKSNFFYGIKIDNELLREYFRNHV